MLGSRCILGSLLDHLSLSYSSRCLQLQFTCRCRECSSRSGRVCSSKNFVRSAWPAKESMSPWASKRHPTYCWLILTGLSSAPSWFVNMEKYWTCVRRWFTRSYGWTVDFFLDAEGFSQWTYKLDAYLRLPGSSNVLPNGYLFACQHRMADRNGSFESLHEFQYLVCHPLCSTHAREWSFAELSHSCPSYPRGPSCYYACRCCWR